MRLAIEGTRTKDTNADFLWVPLHMVWPQAFKD